MNAASRSRLETERGELRRQQVLKAATECFRREGVHGSSIARISMAAGMSAGHIYHYFANKEAIVEAIAAREEDDMAELIRIMEQDQGGGDLLARLTRHIAHSVDRSCDPEYVGLMLELAAEAARNPAVASILQRTNQAISERFRDMARRVGIPRGLDEAELSARMAMIAAVFNGLSLRSVVDPKRDRLETTRMVESMIRALLGEHR
jgi:TetR/AcrR family transcriptional repressor of uid operon